MSAARPRSAASLAAGLALALAVATPAPVLAEAPSKKQLDEIEQEMRESRAREAELAGKAAALARDMAQLRDQMVKGARAVQDRETQVTRLETELKGLSAKEAERNEALLKRRAQLAQTLAALERLALRPPEAMIAYPGNADDTIRSALLLRRYVPLFEERAAALRKELADIAALRDDIARRRAVVERDTASLEQDRGRLAALLAQKEALQRSTDEEKREASAHVRALADQAKDLRDLMAKVEAERKARVEAERKARVEADRRARADAEKRQREAEAAAAVGRIPRTAKPEGLRSFAAAQGHITLPAAGRIVRQFAEATETGAPSRGIVIETRPDAQVVAPYDGQVVFAGIFRGYGQILIIEHSGGYHTLLAGLSRIDVAQNQWLLAGEPVGVTGRSEHGAPRVYMEIRLKGRPINPLPWLAADNSKVNG
ncbi:MAG: murein hydrolase activator EnvC family protein [Candidatus Eiseniibacteriota bacterium]